MLHIVPAESKDISKLTELENQSFSGDRISHRQFRYLITKANSIVVKALLGEILAGYMILLQRKTSKNLRIYSIGVNESVRRQGIAAAMLSYAEEMAIKHDCSRLTLEVCEMNSSAVKLYLATGFSVHGFKKDYYEDGCQALLLHKNITSKDTAS